MSRLPAVSLVLLAVLLTACAHAPGPAADSQGMLQLRETLHIEPHAATARLQYGRIVASNAVQEHDPFCVFEVDTVRPETQRVPPGQFRIVAVSRSVETFAGMPAALPMFPAPWRARRVAFSDDDGPTNIYFKTTFRLQDTQPAASPPVRALTCMSNQNAPGNASFMRHLTMPEIRGALGKWFTLSLGGANPAP